MTLQSVVAVEDGKLVLRIPGIRLVNPTNVRENWRARHRRAQSQRGIVRIILQARVRRFPLPVIVTVTRMGPGLLDVHDSLPVSAKHVVDGVADAYGRSDDDPDFTWCYKQDRASEWAVRIAIEKRT